MRKKCCLDCLNKQNDKYYVHGYTSAKCSICKNKNRKGLKVTFARQLVEMPCTHPDGCDSVKVRFVCTDSDKRCP